MNRQTERQARGGLHVLELTGAARKVADLP
jgi:hypothetical protein